MSQKSAYSAAIKNGKPYHATSADTGRNDQSVATAPGGDANDIASFLGPLPPFSGRQRADERFSRETWDMPDKCTLISCATTCYIVLVSNSLYGFYHFLSYIYILQTPMKLSFLQAS